MSLKTIYNVFKEILAILFYLYIIFWGSLLSYILTPFLIFTPYGWLVILYLIWMFTLDKDTSEEGGRRIEWIRSLRCWSLITDYFPIKLFKADGIELDPSKNYLFACFPHGIITTGPVFSLLTENLGFYKLFPHHKPYVCTLKMQFWAPIHRELLFALGCIAPSAKSLNWVLGDPNGGNVAALVVGGAQESLYNKPGVYKLYLKTRKGFAKIALRNGSPLVPVFSFGEVDIYDQLENPEGSLLRRFQNWYKNIVGVSPIIVKGRGFIQPNMIPRKCPVNTFGK